MNTMTLNDYTFLISDHISRELDAMSKKHGRPAIMLLLDASEDFPSSIIKKLGQWDAAKRVMRTNEGSGIPPIVTLCVPAHQFAPIIEFDDCPETSGVADFMAKLCDPQCSHDGILAWTSIGDGFSISHRAPVTN